MLGFILAVVSPAVVVPGMLNLKEQGYGEDKQISTLVLAGASVDDVFAITLFTTFLGLGVQGQTNLLFEIGKIPLSSFLKKSGGWTNLDQVLETFTSTIRFTPERNRPLLRGMSLRRLFP